MYKHCKTVPSKARQHHIADTLLTLMKKQSFSQIPISTVCRSAGISRNVFYRYFDTKEDVVIFLMDCLWDEFDQFMQSFSFPTDKENYIRRKLEIFFSFWYTKRDTLNLFIDNHLVNILFDRLLLKNCEQEPRAVILPLHSSAEQMPLHLIFAIYGMAALLLKWHDQNYIPLPEKMAEESIYIFTEPLLKPAE